MQYHTHTYSHTTGFTNRKRIDLGSPLKQKIFQQHSSLSTSTYTAVRSLHNLTPVNVNQRPLASCSNSLILSSYLHDSFIDPLSFSTDYLHKQNNTCCFVPHTEQSTLIMVLNMYTVAVDPSISENDNKINSAKCQGGRVT